MPRGPLARFVGALLARPGAEGFPDDDPRSVPVHAAVLRSSPFLRRLYLLHYRMIADALAGAPPGPVLELGSGAGFLREVIPGVVTSDVVAAPGVDRVMPAGSIDAPDNSLSGIVMLNVFHHLSDPAAFLREARRALAPGGRLVMIEPAHTFAWARLYRAFSPEPYDENADWGFPAGGRISRANIPQAWMVFVRDRERFRREHPGWGRLTVRRHTAFLFLLAGGFRYRSLVPGWSFPAFAAIERAMTPFMPWIASDLTVVREKAL